ncbi:MAG: response regulator transcription factor [Alphaproteobacteria bacterium]|nr:response regulator transcription factor [Alphaproteobacteria bacterium]
MKILVLEDEPDTAGYLRKGLSQAGHVVDLCHDGRDAFHLALEGVYDVLVVDRMAPGMDGLKMVKSLRAAGVLTPVLFLTALGGIGDRVEGLEAGGDDYLVKPFAFTELVARLNALARRPPIAEVQTVLQVGDLQLDMLKRTVARAGRRIDLKPQEFRLLEFLMKHAGQIVTRTMLLENVWSFHFDPKTNIVESHMSRIRAKVDRGFGKELIQTVRGAGYRIDASA